MFIQLLNSQIKSRGMLTLFLLVATLVTKAQTETITGRVSDLETDETLTGVTVTNKNTGRMTSSDLQGMFEVSAAVGDSLQFMFIGYETRVVGVIDRQQLTIGLQPASTDLQEVVVTALGIKRERQAVGYSVQEVKGETMVKAREPNAVAALTGRIAGLTVTPSTNLFGNPGVTLRGRSNVLFVVDGMPINTDSWNLSPDDIESFSVLKGANAAALYGSRGQNGAIVITTKRATANDKGFQVEFNSSTQLQAGYNAVPKQQTEYGAGANFEYEYVDGRGGGINDGDYLVWGPRFENQLITQYNSPVNPETGELEPLPWKARGVDNLKSYLENGLLSTNNIAISTKGAHGDFRISLTQLYQKGTTPNTKLGGTNVNISGGVNAGSKLRFDGSINYNKQYSPNYPNLQYGPQSPIYIMTVWGGTDYDVRDLRNYWQPGKEDIQQYNREYLIYDNPWLTAYENLRTWHKDDIYGHVMMNYDITDKLSFNARTSVSTWNRKKTLKVPISANLYNYDIGGSRVGGYQEDYDRFWENNTEASIKYTDRFFGDLGFNASVFANLRTVSVSSLLSRANGGLIVPGVYDLSNSVQPTVATNDYAKRQIVSTYGFIDLEYKNRLYLNLTGRVDKSSTMPLKHNTYFYPSASLSVVLSEMIDLPQSISLLKLRGAYANVASDFVTEDNQYNIYRLLTTYTNYGRWQNSYTGITYASTLPNQDLLAERVKSLELGLELRFFQGRLGLDVAAFRNIEGPRIMDLTTSVTSGVNARQINGLTLLRKGYELTLDGIPISKPDFSWNVLLNAYANHAWLHEIDGEQTRHGNIYVGERWDSYYIRDFQRDEDGKMIVASNGMPVYNNFNTKAGYYDNKINISLNNSFRYKTWSFSFMVDARLGGLISNYLEGMQWASGTHPESANEYRLRDWENRGTAGYLGSIMTDGLKIESGQLNTDQDGNIISDTRVLVDNDVPVLWQNWATNYYRSDYHRMMDRSFAKLREVTITYAFPQSWITRSKLFRSASVSLVGRNLLYITGKGTRNTDLDQFIGSDSDFQTPSVKSFGLNLNASF